jgi:hypothetical protein
VLAVKAHADPNPGVILHTLPRLLLAILLLRAHLAVRLALDHQAALARGHQPLEDRRKLPGHLLEGALDGLVLALVEVVDELLDRALRRVELRAPLLERVALLCEVVELLESLLVDVRVLLERLLDGVEPLHGLRALEVVPRGDRSGSKPYLVRLELLVLAESFVG